MLAAWLLLFVLFVAPVPAVIQDAPNGVTGLGQLWFDTTSSTLKYCSAISESSSGGTNCTTWSSVPSGSGPGGLPTGAIVFISSGTCPSGTTEAVDLDGQMFQATTSAHANVGTTGGSNSITPAGTNGAPALTMNSYTPAGSVAAPTFSGTLGTVPAETATCTTAKFSSGTGSAPTACTAVTNGTASFTPAGTNSVPAFTGTPATLTGSVAAPAFSGIAFDPHPQFTRLIPCRAN